MNQQKTPTNINIELFLKSMEDFFKTNSLRIMKGNKEDLNENNLISKFGGMEAQIRADFFTTNSDRNPRAGHFQKFRKYCLPGNDPAAPIQLGEQLLSRQEFDDICSIITYMAASKTKFILENKTPEDRITDYKGYFKAIKNCLDSETIEQKGAHFKAVPVKDFENFYTRFTRQQDIRTKALETIFENVATDDQNAVLSVKSEAVCDALVYIADNYLNPNPERETILETTKAEIASIQEKDMQAQMHTWENGCAQVED